MEERDYEKDAQKMGWVPQDEWKGNPEAWREAEEFVERGENIVPILKDRVSKLEADLKTTIKLNEAEAKKAEARGFESAKKAYDKDLADLKKKQMDAVQEGDVEEFEKVEEEISSLEKPEEPEEAQTNPVFEDWNKKNEWYGTDDKLTQYANFLSTQIAPEKLPPEEFYAKIQKTIKETFPEKFENKKRKEPDMVGGGDRVAQKNGKKKTFSDLPSDARSAFNRLSKQFEMKGRKLEKEDYVKTYFEEE